MDGDEAGVVAVADLVVKDGVGFFIAPVEAEVAFVGAEDDAALLAPLDDFA